MRRLSVLVGALAGLVALGGVVSPARGQGTTDPYAPPPGYYDLAQGKTGQDLRQALNDIIDNHTRRTYDQVWAILAEADADPANPNHVLTFYKNSSVPASDHGLWNREHTWPTSYGFPDDTRCNYPYTDAHHLHAEDGGYNSSRGNKPFDWCLRDCAEKSVYKVPGAANRTKGAGATGTWEVWSGRRGDVARALFYMDVRYEGGTHQDGCAEPDLMLTDDRSLMVTVGENVTGTAHMGILTTLLAWDREDGAGSRAKQRNEVVFAAQGNRNPFIDHPEWACSVRGVCATEEPTAPITVTMTVTPTLAATVLPSSMR